MVSSCSSPTLDGDTDCFTYGLIEMAISLG
jgi:hypothetical protein